MKKILIPFLFLLFFVSALSAETIKVVTSLYDPFVYYKDGKLVGFDVDLLEKICERNNLKYSIEIVPFNQLIESVSSGYADVAIGAIYVTDDRKTKVEFTHPYLKTGLVYVTSVDFKGDLNDLTGKKVGVKKGATGEKLALDLAKKFSNCKVISYKSTDESIEALLNNKVDLVLNDYINTHILMVRDYRGKIYMPTGYFNIPKLVSKDYIAFPINPVRKDLLQKFDETLKKLEKEGAIKELLKKWPEIKPYPNVEMIVVLNIGMLSLIFLVLLGVFKYFKDKQILKLALEKEKKLQAILDNSPNVVILHKVSGEIVFLNMRFFEIFDKSYVQSNNVFDFYSLVISDYEEIKRLKESYQELFSKKINKEIIDLHFVDREGKKRNCDIQTSYVGMFDKEDLFLTIIRDETYIKELEQKYYQSQKLESIGRLAGGIAHDFNNFLTAINGFAFLSLMDIENRDFVENNLRKIIEASERAANITSQLLTFSRKQFDKPIVHNIS